MRAMQYAATFGYAVWLQPEDLHLARNGVAHEGEVASRLGLAGIPSSAEVVALATIWSWQAQRVPPARLPGFDGRFGSDDPRRQGTWHCGDSRTSQSTTCI